MSSNVLLAIGDALYRVFSADATLAALGGVHMDIPPNVDFPLVWLELQQDQEHGAFGSKPGRKNKPGVNLRVHVYVAEGKTLRAGQLVMARVIDLLWNDDAPLSVDGYSVWFNGQPSPDARTFQFADQELRGQKCKESVLMADYILEKAA